LKNQTQITDESSNQPADQESRIDWMNILSILWSARRFIVVVTCSATLAAGIIAFFLLPKYYKSTAVILPDADKSKIGSLGGGLTDLAAMAGVNVGGEGSIVKLYPTILKSESVLKSVIYTKYKTDEYKDSVDLIHYWDISEYSPEREYEVALLSLRNALEVSIDIKLNVVTISLETKEPQLSADILNTVIRSMDNFIRTKRNTNALEQRKWIEARLVEVKEDLSSAENTLKIFREKNRSINGSPQLLLDQERFFREVQINSTMYVELKKQHEIAKIEEIRTTPIINVMDYGRPAAKKERPKRGIIMLVTMLLACVGSGSYRVIDQMYGKNFRGWYGRLRSS
jgi:uncharacterized protein involved in exopolysaccharide biosynthesis